MSTLRFDGKVAIITGAARGLGREYALMLAARGAKVVINDLACGTDGSPTDAGTSVADELVGTIVAAGGAALANGDNVVDGANAVVEAALAAFGQVDILINNAGISGGGPFADIPPADWNRMVDTHLGGTVAMCRAAWPHLARQGGGRIINSSSSASFGAGYSAHYSTAKSAMIGLTRSLAQEGTATGITVNAVMPSAFTRLTAQIPDDALRNYLADHFPPERVAAFIVWLLSTSINGEIFAAGGGRAARVVLAEGRGADVSEDVPEAWADVADPVMSLAPLHTPMSMVEELCDKLEFMGPEGAALAAGMRGGADWSR